MTRKSKKNLLIIIATLFIGGAGIGYYLWNKPHKDVKHATAVKVTAATLYNTFSNDSATARTLYTDKVLEISGRAAQLSTNQQNQQVILLNTMVADASINCTMEENATGIKTGDSITIKGICSGYIAGDTSMGLPGDVFIIRGYHLK